MEPHHTRRAPTLHAPALHAPTRAIPSMISPPKMDRLISRVRQARGAGMRGVVKTSALTGRWIWMD